MVKYLLITCISALTIQAADRPTPPHQASNPVIVPLDETHKQLLEEIIGKSYEHLIEVLEHYINTLNEDEEQGKE